MGFFDDDDGQTGLSQGLLGGAPLPHGLASALSDLTSLAPPPAGSAGPVAAETPQAPSPPPPSPRLSGDNVQLLGRILTSECGDQQYPCSPQEIQAIGSTVINRMDHKGTDKVSDVTHVNGRPQYALGKEPTPGMLFTAERMLSGQLGDNTGRAMNFYSPRSMPLENQPRKGDTSGGLEYVPGDGRRTTLQNYRPGWVKDLQQRTIPGVRDWYLKVYGPP